MTWKFWRRPKPPAPAAPAARPRASLRVPDGLIARMSATTNAQPFELPRPAPGVLPDGVASMALDDGLTCINTWAAQAGGVSGLAWLGYTILAELAQRPEYRRIARVKANEMTRRWVKLQGVGGENKNDRIEQLLAALERFKVRDAFRRAAELDGLFGRAHLYLDTGHTDDPDELRLPLTLSKEKIGKGSLKALRVIEPIWTYPSQYNSTDPLRPDFYRPQAWYVMGKEIHASRLLTFVGREMPDLLKPAYMFGGMSLTQMAKPYVDLWLKDRTAVSDIVNFFSTSVLKTNIRGIQEESGEDGLINRMQLWSLTRKNRDVMLLDKDTEDFANVSAPLGTLDKLVAQAQEHICSVIGMPLVKYTGISPAGLNASSEGEIRVWYDEVHADQEDEFGDHLARVLDAIQLSEFGEIDPGITHEFVSLWEMSESERATVRKTDADTDVELLNAGVLSPEEVRGRVARAEGSAYSNIDVGDVPEAPEPGGSLDEPEPGALEPSAADDDLDANSTTAPQIEADQA